MAMAETMVSGWRCTGRTEDILGIYGTSTSRPALPHRRSYFVKAFGSPALPIVGLHLEQQRKRGLMRRSGRERPDKDGMPVRGVPRPIREEGSAEPSSLTQYTDSWLEVKAVEFLTDQMSVLCGKTTDVKGYDGFVDMTRKFVHGLPSTLQRERVNELLNVVLPQWLLFCFRIIPKTTSVKEIFAKFTLIFFKWLVGECEVREGAIDGVMMKSTVHIKKCRYLEQSRCVGLCVNLCKSPTQRFILEQFGMPLTMNPNGALKGNGFNALRKLPINTLYGYPHIIFLVETAVSRPDFEDMSCDMIYGLHPPSLEEDAAYQQPCYALCETAKKMPNCA